MSWLFPTVGTVTGQDYESILIPAIEEKLDKYQKIRLLYHLGDEFSSFDAQALWDDTKVGFQHLMNWEKIAVVSDISWLDNTITVLGFIMPCPVKVFSNHELAAAIEWISNQDKTVSD